MEVKQAPLRGAWPSTPAIAIDATLRRGRIVEARRLALETSRATQARYRQALVLEVEEELRQRKVRDIPRAALAARPPSSPSSPPSHPTTSLSPLTQLSHARAPPARARPRGRLRAQSAWRRCRQCTRAR
jgi:hypothetical protein